MRQHEELLPFDRVDDEACDVVWLEKGRVVMDGPTEQVVDAYEDKYDPQARTKAATHPAESSV